MEKMTNKHSTKKTNHSSHKKVFDVMRPGKAPASPTSRPVITTQKSVPDDQFTSGRKVLAGDPDEKHELMDGKKRIAIKPADSPAGEIASSKTVSKKTEKVADEAKQDEHQAFSAPVLDKATLSALTEEAKGAPVAKADVASKPSSDIDAKVLLEQLAVEQVVEAPAEEVSPSEEQAPSAETGAPSDTQSGSAKTHAKTIDELLAETGAPQLDTAPESTKPLVSYHRRGHSFFVTLLAIIIGAVIGLAILNFLLDAEIIHTTRDLPHTDWL